MIIKKHKVEKKVMISQSKLHRKDSTALLNLHSQHQLVINLEIPINKTKMHMYWSQTCLVNLDFISSQYAMDTESTAIMSVHTSKKICHVSSIISYTLNSISSQSSIAINKTMNKLSIYKNNFFRIGTFVV